MRFKSTASWWQCHSEERSDEESRNLSSEILRSTAPDDTFSVVSLLRMTMPLSDYLPKNTVKAGTSRSSRLNSRAIYLYGLPEHVGLNKISRKSISGMIATAITSETTQRTQPGVCIRTMIIKPMTSNSLKAKSRDQAQRLHL